MKEWPLYIGGQEGVTVQTVPVYQKETNETIAEIAVAGEAECRAAVDAAEKAFREVKLSAYERYEIILKAANLMRERPKNSPQHCRLKRASPCAMPAARLGAPTRR